MPQFTFQFGNFEDQNNSHSSVLASTSNVLNSKVMHSWVYPQSTLPPSLISVLTSSAAEGGVSNKFVYLILGETPPLPPSTLLMLSFVLFCAVEMDFLRKRQLAWEDSFRSLYYMLRNNVCNVFYGNHLFSHYYNLFSSPV